MSAYAHVPISSPFVCPSGRGEDASAQSGLLSAIAASILGGGGGLGFGPGPLFGGPGMEVPPWGGGGTRGRRGAAVVPRHPAGAGAPQRTEFRAELAQAACSCAACGQLVGELTARIGMRPQPQTRRSQPPWRWHHVQCVTAQQWREARTVGIGNLRGIPAAEQSRVRQYMSLAPP